IHKRLWPEFLAIANSQESWQFDKLSKEGKELYAAVESQGLLRTNEHSKITGVRTRSLGDAARELESKILVYGHGFHTKSGAHAKLLKTWTRWIKDTNYHDNRQVEVQNAKDTFKDIVERLKQRYGARARLPWERSVNLTVGTRKKNSSIL
ncbi:MAG TPA: hypothetical protein VE177_02005, partial [Candidatus Binatus sp.]|nr:hypothetical protein [Candidatus Binatus sp.]